MAQSTAKPQDRWPSEFVHVAEEVPIEDLPGPRNKRSLHPNIPEEGGEAGKSGSTAEPKRPIHSMAKADPTPTPRLRLQGPARPERASILARLALPERLAAAGNIHLFQKKLVGPGHKPVAYNIYLATLQRMVLGQLRSELAEVVSNIYTGRIAEKDLMDRAKELLTDYCNAVRDHDFMAERLKQAQDNDEDDPFEISTRHVLDLCLMNDAGLVPAVPSHWEELFSKATDKGKYKGRLNILPSASRHVLGRVKARHQYFERLGMGLAGGAALIVPVLIMVLHKDLVTSLVITSSATMIFAGGLAFLGKKLQGETVLASVAAYAAVLVVFIGSAQ